VLLGIAYLDGAGNWEVEVGVKMGVHQARIAIEASPFLIVASSGEWG